MEALPSGVERAVRVAVGAVCTAAPVGGGCIARALRLETERGTFFLKWAAGKAGAHFGAEAHGLRTLRGAGSPLRVPEPLAARDADAEGPGFLLTTWLPTAPASRASWRRLGEGLAALHAHTEPDGRYGLERDNVIGRLPQLNGWMGSWPAFFRERRLLPQIERARAAGRWRPAWDVPAERLLARLDDLVPERPPASLLHGDFWSGNALALEGGGAGVVDPAVYFGHRETDLAMAELFGGFDPAFHEAYRAAWPLDPGYAARRDVYNLYHLINHLNHFGAGYAGTVEAVLRRYG